MTLSRCMVYISDVKCTTIAKCWQKKMIGMVAKVLKTYDNGCQMLDVDMYMRHDIFVKCWQDTYDMEVKCKCKRNCWQDCNILWHTLMSYGMSCHSMSWLGCQMYKDWLIVICLITNDNNPYNLFFKCKRDECQECLDVDKRMTYNEYHIRH